MVILVFRFYNNTEEHRNNQLDCWYLMPLSTIFQLYHDNQFSLEEKRRVPGQNVFIDWFLYAINVNIILLLKTKEYIYTVIKQFTNIINKFLIVEDHTVTVKCRTAIKTLFLHFNLCLKCKVR